MLGELLGDWRNINYVKARDLTDGITTVKMLKKYETGKKRPEKLRADALWQRAGKSMDKFDIYLEQEEYRRAKERAEIQEQMRMGRLEEAEKKLEEYESWSREENKTLHWQFACLQRAELYRRKKEPLELQKQVILEGLRQTIQETEISPELLRRRRLDTMELLLLERYAFLIEQQQPQQAMLWYTKILNYFERGVDFDCSDQRKILPPVQYHAATLFFRQGQYKEALNLLASAQELLKERYWLCALFVKIKKLEFQIRQQTNQKVSGWEIACYDKMLEAMKDCSEQWQQNTYPDYLELALHSVNETVRERRIARGIKTEKLAENICEIRTLKAVESGRQQPQKKNRDALFGALGLSLQKYDGWLVTRRYQDFGDSVCMMECDYIGETERMEQLYQTIIKRLSRKEVTNQQFIEYWGIQLQYKKEEITEEQYRSALWKMLRKTLPDFSGQEGRCILTRYETIIIETLSWTAEGKEMDVVQRILEEQYQRFTKETALTRFFPNHYLVIFYCLGRIARKKKEFEKARNYLDTALGQIYYLCSDLHWSDLLFQRFQLEEDEYQARKESGMPKKEMEFRYIQYAYAIEKLYLKDTVGIKFIESYLDRHYSGKKQMILGSMFDGEK